MNEIKLRGYGRSRPYDPPHEGDLDLNVEMLAGVAVMALHVGRMSDHRRATALSNVLTETWFRKHSVREDNNTVTFAQALAVQRWASQRRYHYEAFADFVLIALGNLHSTSPPPLEFAQRSVVKHLWHERWDHPRHGAPWQYCEWRKYLGEYTLQFEWTERDWDRAHDSLCVDVLGDFLGVAA